MEYFNVIKPIPQLADYVRQYWILRISGGAPAGERTIPVGSVSLVFHRGSRMRSLTSGNVQPKAFLGGVSGSYNDVQATGDLNMLVVVFQPFGPGAFFRLPLSETYDRNVALAEVGDRALEELGSRILDEPDDMRAVALIEGFLLARLQNADTYNMERLQAAVRRADRDAAADVRAMAGDACLSTRQFGRVFSDNVGVGPKEFLRIVRFQRALHALQASPAISFAQLAFDSGYFDQPHMIREFKAFSGYTPAEYLAVCTPYSDYFS